MSIALKEEAGFLQDTLENANIHEVLEHLYRKFPGQLAFSTSFSFEDQVITDHISKSVPVTIFTLDTGRLFPETYSTWSRTLEKYGMTIEAWHPEEARLNEFISNNGPNAFYNSAELRKECCTIRKVVPLKKALNGNAVWITGLRAEHSPNRSSLRIIEWDDVNKIIKYNPLLRWTTEQVKQYIKNFDVPYNVLHDRGFVSIGCAPCTRAVREGEDFRAGRWWWEDESKKECGLHQHKNIPVKQ